MVKTPSKDFEGRRGPDYQVSLLVKSTSEKGNIGVAWAQSDGSVRIKLNSFVQIPQGSDDLVITCWPNTPVPKTPPKKAPAQSVDYSSPGYSPHDDDVPF